MDFSLIYDLTAGEHLFSVRATFNLQEATLLFSGIFLKFYF